MSFENEDVDSSASSAETNDTQQTEQSDSTSTETADSNASEAAAKAEDKVPFHMHPRFQEVIQEKNAIKEQHAAMQRELTELKQQFKQSTPAEKDELMDRLESIDPKFAALLKGMRDELKATKQQMEELSGWRNQSSAQTAQQQVSTAKERFYTENKIPKERQEFYEDRVARIANANPNIKVSDLPAVLKQVHADIGKMFQSVERATTKTFVETKKGEAAKPATQSKGVPSKAGAKQNNDQGLSAQDIRREMIAEVLAEARGGKDI